MQIIPALLEKSPGGLLANVEKLLPYFPHFQIDIEDRAFVQNKSIRIEDLPKLPTDAAFDFHLMTKDYENDLKLLDELKNNIKIETVFLHFSLNPKYSLLTAKYSSFSLALVLNPEDSVENLLTKYEVSQLPAIQIMSVSPGLQGQDFLPEALKKIEQLRISGYRSKVFLDGGINDKTIPLITSLNYKPDFLVVGSFLVNAEDIAQRVHELNKLLG